MYEARWVISVFCSPRLAKYPEIIQTRFINFILNDHSCKILRVYLVRDNELDTESPSVFRGTSPRR